MARTVDSKLRKWSAKLPSWAGTRLPERIRSTTFAMLGMVVVAGLGLVVLFSQPGWPLRSLGPLAEPSKDQAVDSGVAVAAPATHASVAASAGRTPTHSVAGGHGSATPAGKHATGSLGNAAPSGSGGGEVTVHQPSGGGKQSPTPQEPSPAPSTTPEATRAGGPRSERTAGDDRYDGAEHGGDHGGDHGNDPGDVIDLLLGRARPRSPCRHRLGILQLGVQLELRQWLRRPQLVRWPRLLALLARRLLERVLLARRILLRSRILLR